jgi:hypothetical protein
MLKPYENSNAADEARIDFAKLRWSVTVCATQLQFAKVLTDYSLVAARTAAMNEVDRLEPLSFNCLLISPRRTHLANLDQDPVASG